MPPQILRVLRGACETSFARYWRRSWPLMLKDTACVCGSLASYRKHEFSNHRIIYRIYPQQSVVVVCAVGVRKQGDVEDVYRRLESVVKTGRLAGQLALVLKNLLTLESVNRRRRRA